MSKTAYELGSSGRQLAIRRGRAENSLKTGDKGRQNERDAPF